MIIAGAVFDFCGISFCHLLLVSVLREHLRVLVGHEVQRLDGLWAVEGPLVPRVATGLAQHPSCLPALPFANVRIA